MSIAAPIADFGEASFEDRTYAKVAWRLIPFLILCYVVAYLDRVNVGFAKLQMLSDLKFSDTVYGFGAGVFFIGFFIFEVPTNLLLHRIGARKVITRIMITWGALSALTMFVTTPTQFYVMRFLLGVAEAGFFPGMILFLTYWFPAERRSRITGLFMTAVPISGLIGGPVSGWIMQTFAGVNGWAGWQWLFLLEGLPAVFIGMMVWYYLDDGITSAKWLDADEKRLLSANIQRESALKTSHSFKESLGDKKVWILSLVYFAVVMGLYGISFWLPTLIKSSGVTKPMDIGLLSAIPYAAAIAAMILVSRSADSRRERKWHFAIPALLGALGLILSVNFAQNTVLVIAALTLACCGIMATLPLFWSYAPAFLGGTAAAGGIALIGSIGNLAGFASPYMVGYIKDLTRSTDAGIYALAACVVISAILVMVSLPARLVNR